MTQVIILGAGIAGLSSGWLLQQQDIDFIVLEKQSFVGGLARSFDWHGFYCDFAAHRLFTRNEEILHQMLNLVPMGRHIRRSRIYLRNHWMADPLDVIELIGKLSINERLGVLYSYLTRPKNLTEGNFEQYVIRRYGRSLYEFFFQPYTEKLFGIPGDQISVLWARQKVRLANPLDNLRENTKTKFQYFYYPIHGGYGAIVNHLYDGIKNRVILGAQATRFETNDGKISKIHYKLNDEEHELPADFVISTLPMSFNAQMLGQSYPLEFQKVDAVYLWINKPRVSDYHWIYFIDSTIAINRLVEFKNMSPVEGDPDTTVLCAEVTQTHPDVANKVIDDLEHAGLIRHTEILDTKVVRENFAYPVYNQDYAEVLQTANQFFKKFENLYLVGRAAEFRHREADDNFEAAIEAINKITAMIPGATLLKEVRIPMPQKTKPVIFAVILTYNHYSDTEECLESLIRSDYQNMKIVLVDNGSSDGTPTKVRELYPQIRVIENGQNMGVPAGYNVGFQYALKNGADYILMLNNDTVIQPNMVSQLLQVAEQDPNIGIVMPKVLYYGSDNEVWSSGGRNRSFPPAILLLDKSNLENDQTRMIEYAPGCGLLIHRQAFEKAGLFDPGYFFFFDDWDFSERVRAYGLHILSVPTTHMWHKVSKTVKGSNLSLYWKSFGASLVRFYRRHGRPVWFSLPVQIGYVILRDFIWKRNWAYIPDFWEGVQEGLQKPLGNYPEIKP